MTQAQQTKNRPSRGQRILRRLDRYIPSEDTKLAAWIRRGILAWQVVKGGLVLGGILILLRSAQVISSAYEAVPPLLLKGMTGIALYFFPFFVELITTSLLYLWQPIVVYMLMMLLISSTVWRKFWCLVGVAGFFLLFVAAYEASTWQEYRLLPLLLLQGYMFMLWLLPREAWNVVGLLISGALGLVILLAPDLPTSFDDFGMAGAVAAFFLGYVNAVASLVQRAAHRL
ncbi:hypothetical protein GF339_21660 [candidate division KSB3 bacterium]|uniref:Uncharacterized protein n=1 Tax=candidate division KSB3 bacterium TaxID=2044937 RepID=A0A9D5Q882_9BACT|nr:hypothetical protein [candidate division KSB3 bacterium]MBD3327208.1 hypothetical protein [candidate division KSB3 bacterium]